jgi:catechol 2,3-dioxygenase-like lactoylglutathione lyase family enzyme
VILPVGDIERATAFYSRLLGVAGDRVTSGRHYFNCGGVILACWDPLADGIPPSLARTTGTSTCPLLRTLTWSGRGRWATERHPTHSAVRSQDGRGVRFLFYARDPWDNPFCVVARGSEYRGGDFGLPGK